MRISPAPRLSRTCNKSYLYHRSSIFCLQVLICRMGRPAQGDNTGRSSHEDRLGKYLACPPAWPSLEGEGSLMVKWARGRLPSRGAKLEQLPISLREPT
jgi:hypothetical protein